MVTTRRWGAAFRHLHSVAGFGCDGLDGIMPVSAAAWQPGAWLPVADS